MTKQEKTIVSLKEALITGGVLDLVALAVASTIMDCGEIFMRVFFLAVAHLIFSVWLVLHYKDTLGEYGRDFIRFGIVIVGVVAFIARFFMGLFLGG